MTKKAPPQKNNTTKTLSVGVRFPHAIVGRLDAAVARHSGGDGPAWTRSDAINVAIKKWLDADEAAAGTVAPPAVAPASTPKRKGKKAPAAE